ncbi:MAG: S41 family peptidase [Terricaulis sp.]
MRFKQVFLAILLLGAASSSAAAWPPRPEILHSLERMADAAARIVDTYCGSENGVFAGALAGINAMHERAGETPIVTDTPGIEGFANAYEPLIESGADYRAVEAAAINGMIHAYDPTGNWFTSDELQYPLQSGGLLMTVEADGATVRVSAVEAGGPAAEAGILVGDRIVEIDSRSTEGMAIPAVERRLHGDIGRTASVIVERDGERIEFDMRRVDSRHSPAPWRLEGGVAIISMTAFPQGSPQALRNSLREIRRQPQPPEGYILDIRNNSGGLFDEIVEVADQFIDGGRVSTVRPFSACRGETAQTYDARGRDETRGARLVVLINGETASGAELVAAALRERRQAILIGQRSHGTARVHTMIPMNGGRDGFMKLSTGVMTSPAGATWDGNGLTPDIITEPAAANSDPAMDRAIALLSRAP